MPTNKEIASELWLHINSPETLDKNVGDHIAKLRREARMDELSEYQNERKEIDAAVDRYLNSPIFESQKKTFLEIDDRDSPELERAVSEMSHELRTEMSEEGRDEVARDVDADLQVLSQAVEPNLQRDEQEPER